MIVNSLEFVALLATVQALQSDNQVLELCLLKICFSLVEMFSISLADLDLRQVFSISCFLG